MQYQYNHNTHQKQHFSLQSTDFQQKKSASLEADPKSNLD
jgi:hypothetical protein